MLVLPKNRQVDDLEPEVLPSRLQGSRSDTSVLLGHSPTRLLVVDPTSGPTSDKNDTYKTLLGIMQVSGSSGTLHIKVFVKEVICNYDRGSGSRPYLWVFPSVLWELKLWNLKPQFCPDQNLGTRISGTRNLVQ